MTREEAIEMIASMGKYMSSGNPIWKTEPVKEATDMAIEALKEKNRSDSLVRDDAENCKESESKLDLISRAEAVALVNRAIRGIGDKDVQECLFDGIRKQMWALPSEICDDCIWRVCNYNKIDWEMVDTMAEPKTGEWIPVSDIRKLEAVVYMHIDSLEGTRNIVEAGMLSAWKEVAEYVDGMLGEDGEA